MKIRPIALQLRAIVPEALHTMAMWIEIGAGGYVAVLALVLALCRAAKREESVAAQEYERWALSEGSSSHQAA